LNYLLASHVWQQDHNGFTRQDPGFLDHVINKKADIVRFICRRMPIASCRYSTIACAPMTSPSRMSDDATAIKATPPPMR
jgi:hypothetical protein